MHKNYKAYFIKKYLRVWHFLRIHIANNLLVKQNFDVALEKSCFAKIPTAGHTKRADNDICVDAAIGTL